MVKWVKITSSNSHLFLDPRLDRGLVSKDDFHLERTDCFTIREYYIQFFMIALFSSHCFLSNTHCVYWNLRYSNCPEKPGHDFGFTHCGLAKLSKCFFFCFFLGELSFQFVIFHFVNLICSNIWSTTLSLCAMFCIFINFTLPPFLC